MKKSRSVKSFTVFSRFVILAVTVSAGCGGGRIPLARNGVLDLRSWDFKNNSQLKIHGEWTFYWETFLTPDAPPGTHPAPSSLIPVPKSWRGASINGEEIPGTGYATYRLIILLPENTSENSLLALFIRNISSSFELFVNGRRVAGNGIPAAESDSAAPGRFPLTVPLSVKSNRLDMIIHVANFHQWKGGIWEDIIIGTENSIRRSRIVSHSYEMFILSSVVVMGLYQLTLWFFRRRNRVVLTFGIFCLLMAVRTLTTDFKYGINLLTFLPWELVHCTKHITFLMGFAVFTRYIRLMFPSVFPRIIVTVSFAAGIIVSAAVILLPIEIYFRIFQIHEVMVIGFGTYILFALIRAVHCKLEGAGAVATGSIFLFAAMVNDMLYSARIISSAYIFLWGMLVFIFVQAWVLARRANHLLITVERQTVEQRHLIKERTEAHEKFTVSRLGTILGLAKLAEYRDEDTGFHLERIREYSRCLAAYLIDYPEYRHYITHEYIDDLYQSSILHDIGKVWVKDIVLLKTGRLSEEEFKHMKQHTTKGGDIIRDIERQVGTPAYLELGRKIAYSHHEKWDGSGYPEGLRGKDIPLSARIVAVADVYDALTSKRPYKKAFSHEKAVSIISEGRGSHFDPELTDTFLEINREFNEIRLRLNPHEPEDLTVSK